jgi:hypothetical protein
VTVEDASVNIDGTTTFVAHVLDENNAPATSGSGIFKINMQPLKDGNGKVIMVNVDSNGTLTLTGFACPTSATEGRTYTLYAVMNQDDNYMRGEGTATLTVRKTPVLIVSDVTANRGDTIYLSTSVTYNNENVTEGTVTFILEQT